MHLLLLVLNWRFGVTTVCAESFQSSESHVLMYLYLVISELALLLEKSSVSCYCIYARKEPMLLPDVVQDN